MQRVFLILLIFSSLHVNGQTGFAGGHISYQALGNDSFKILITAFYNCSAINNQPVFNNSNTLISSSCDTLSPNFSAIDLAPNDTSRNYEIVYLNPNSNCNNLAYKKWQFEFTGYFQPCQDWRISTYMGPRFTNVNLSNNTAALVLEFDNLTARNNSGPFILNDNVGVFPLGGGLVKSILLTEDNECDTLKFKFHAGFKSHISQNNYIFPYNDSLPITTITIDNNSSLTTCLPTASGNFLVVYKIDEIKKGKVISSSYVETFASFIPSNFYDRRINNSFLISGSSGISKVSTDSTEFFICENDSFSIELDFFSLNNSDSISLNLFGNPAINNYSSNFLGPNFNQSRLTINGIGKKITGSCANFYVVGQNDKKFGGTGTPFAFKLNVVSNAKAIYDNQLCLGDSSFIELNHNQTINWNVIYGDPLDSLNFGNTSSKSTWAFPDSSVAYEVQIQNNGCTSTDSVIIDVTQPKNLKINLEDTICENQTFKIDSITNYPFGNWVGGKTGNLFDPSILGVGNHILIYTLADTTCNWIDSAISQIYIAPKPIISVSAVPPICETVDSLALNFATPSGGYYFGIATDNNNFYPQMVGPGIYQLGYTFTNAEGCLDSVFTNIQVDTALVTPNIIQVGLDSLKADVIVPKYNWYYNQVLMGDTTQQIFVGFNNGNYEVEAIRGACTSIISNMFSYIYIGIDEGEKEFISIFPNPTETVLNINSSEPIVLVSVYNELGQEVIRKSQISEGVNLEGLPSGIYFVEIKTKGGNTFRESILKK